MGWYAFLTYCSTLNAFQSISSWAAPDVLPCLALHLLSTGLLGRGNYIHTHKDIHTMNEGRTNRVLEV